MKKPKQTKTSKAGSPRKAPKTPVAARAPKAPRTRERDPRLPAAGTTIKRDFKGMTFRVHVLEDGFRCNGEEWRSLSALASKITGNSTNGFLWFGLTERPAATPKEKAPKRKGKPAAPKDAAPEAASAPESATA